METEIIDRLGNGFSRAPFATVVAICTVVSLVACVPLGELFFFHIILIRKGITTYEYVVAMRTITEDIPSGAYADEQFANFLNSPSGSATTGLSGGSSLGLQYKGAWCTPPRVFVDYQEEVAPHLEPGMVPSTVDPDAAGIAGKGDKVPKKPIKLSAWKLAKLDSNEAMIAAAKARASSSVLRPIDKHHMPDPDLSSSSNVSVRSSVSTDTGRNKDAKNELRLSPLRNSFAPSQGSQDEYDTGTQCASSFSSPSHAHESVTLSPLPISHGPGQFNAISSRPELPNSKNPIASYFSSGFEEHTTQKNSSTDPLLLSAPVTTLLRDVKRTSVVWDQEAGRYVSVPISASENRNRQSLQIGSSNFNPEKGNYKRATFPPPESSSSAHKPPLQQSEKLLYTGDSIFFGGPLLSVPVKDSSRNDRGTGSREGQERALLNLSRESRFKRDAASNQLPVFLPGSAEHYLPSGSAFK